MARQSKVANTLRDTLAATAAKRTTPTKSDVDKSPERELEMEPIPGAPLLEPAKALKTETLPKVTLYAHAEVIKAIRLLAVQDGVQAQVILRRAVQQYLAERGHPFSDLTTGT